MKGWKISGIVATLVIVLVIPLQMLKYYLLKEPNADRFPTFTGSNSCIECHRIEYNLWKSSDHYNSMDTASERSVSGDFNGVTFQSGGIVSRFYKKDGGYYVNTAGQEGKMTDYEILYTFGVRPLQQYLVETEPGRLQCLNLAWDTEKKRWFSLSDAVYAGQEIKPDDWLYWTNLGQNWNGMCADCHSTDLKKGLDPKSMKFNTTWSDINVGCESCHGPGSAHIEWAKLPEGNRPADVNTMLVVKTSDLNNRQYVDECARCHSRRSVLSDFDYRSQEYMDYFIPEPAVEPFYYVDGQIREEDYEYTSFLQSKMFMKGVRCSDCHNAHSLQFVKEGNGLCLQCHRADQYDTYTHHFHKKTGREEKAQAFNMPPLNIEGEGARCINCHMDGHYYMGVDYRRDHSFRVPRPDLTLALGVPNACNTCHTDKSAQWSEDYIVKWYGISRKPQYGTYFAQGGNLEPAAVGPLVAMAQSELIPPMVRATSLGILAGYDNNVAAGTLQSLTPDPDPLVRYNAAKGFTPATMDELLRVYVPLLNDPVRSIRMEAAVRLSPYLAQITDTAVVRTLKNTIEEYEQAMLYTGDFPASRHNLGILYTNLGNTREAERQYRLALDIDKLFYPAMANLARVMNLEGNNEEALKIYRELMATQPGLPDLNYSMALLLSEMGRYDEALPFFGKALAETPNNPRIYYNYGLLLNQLGKTVQSETALLKALSLSPGNPDFLYALSTFYNVHGDHTKAVYYARELARIMPADPDVQNYLKQLGE